MSKPNKTVAAFKRAPSDAAVASRQARFEASPAKVIMDKVQAGEMTIAEGVAEINKMMA